MRRHPAHRIAFHALIWCVFAAATLVGTHVSHAQAGSLELEVIDAAGKKIPLVRITMTDASGAVVMQQTTTKKGKAEFGLNQPGTYSMTLDKAGFGSRTLPVEIQTGQITVLTTKMWDQATQNKQDAVDAFNQAIGMIQSRQGEPLELLQKAAQLDPAMADSHRLIAVIQAENGDLEAAGAALDTYLKLVPDGLSQAATAAYEVFRARGQNDQLGPVREHLRAMGANKDFATRVFNEGVAAVREKEKDKALGLFAEASLLDPDMTQAYRSSAAVHFNDEAYAEALPFLNKVLEKDPQNLEAYRLSFFSLIELGQTEEAKARAKAWRGRHPG